MELIPRSVTYHGYLGIFSFLMRGIVGISIPDEWHLSVLISEPWVDFTHCQKVDPACFLHGLTSFAERSRQHSGSRDLSVVSDEIYIVFF